MVDLEEQLKFPQHIVTSTLRPDVALVSNATKQVVLLELTVPWESPEHAGDFQNIIIRRDIFAQL